MMFNKKTAIICAAVVAWGLSGATSQAATYQLSPGDNIQATIDTSVTGDTIVLAAGIYTITDQLHIANKGITLRGSGTASDTIIQRDAGAATNFRVLFIEGTEPTGGGTYNSNIGTVIDGLTIRNGVTSGMGGNVYVKQSPYTVIKNSIIENGSASSGAGIGLEVGGTLLNTIVRYNTTQAGGLNLGGGVYMRYGGNAIKNSIIYGNQSVVGGGVAIQYGGIDNDPALGGANSRSSILNSTIADNTASGYFSTYYGGGVGSQLYGKTAFITDSIVWDNVRGNSSSSDILNIGSNGGTLTVSNTDAGNNESYTAATNNISTDPQFVGTGTNPWEKYRLADGSSALTGSSTNGVMGAVALSQVPEPANLGLILGLGFVGLAFLSRYLRRNERR